MHCVCVCCSNDDQTLLLKDKDSSHSEQREVGAYTDEL